MPDLTALLEASSSFVDAAVLRDAMASGGITLSEAIALAADARTEPGGAAELLLDLAPELEGQVIWRFQTMYGIDAASARQRAGLR